MFWPGTKVFLSYRREDARLEARSLYTDLAAAFGRRHVFFDLHDIDYGDAFGRVIDKRIDACDVVVVVIGPAWLTLADADGRPRIQGPRDFVRHEIASALARDKRIIPVLIGGAAMPDARQLPADIAGLCALNALVLGDRELGENANRLVDAIRGETATARRTDTLWLRLLRWLGLASAVLMFFAAWLALFDLFGLDTRTASVTLWLADLAAPVQASNEVQMVVIDSQTERVLKKPFTRNPTARRDHALLIQKLSQAGARTIAFDIFITAPSPADDAVLVAAITQARALKTAVVFGAEDIDAGGPVVLPPLRQAVTGIAMLCYGERLGYASTAPLASQKSQAAGASDAQAGAIGIALATAYPGATRVDAGARKVLVAGASGIHEFPFSEFEPVAAAQHCKVGGVGDSVATILYRAASLAALNHPDRRIAYETVLSMDAVALHRRFEGKSVLVGLAMPDDDEFRTFHGLSAQTRHGIELHADAAGALLGDRVVQPVRLGTQFATMAVLGWLGSRLSRWLPPQLPRWARVLALLATAAVCAASAVALCAWTNRLLNLTYLIGALTVGYWLARRAEQAR